MAATTTARTKAKPAAAKPSTGAGVKGRPAKGAGKKGNGRAMVAMQKYFKEHRAEFASLSFKDQQKELGKMWKVSSENPKNA
ncbi:hypothetical protein K432DRAFT_376903 [Lepidopterella palustris CBS 459.81]|uniref:HMG box domain-containing protein n=1 Tax=Lepidopterella palustris CBS 459.81 TaxID=1314670 RepID=A0A8E2JKW0_9PEZI|nr:hypothetical protein K432DRAFT_376903 [Lepidopterella palustris CBS 459.81]